MGALADRVARGTSRPGRAAVPPRARAAAFVEALRRSDRFLKMRAAIVAAWAVLSMATLWGACSAPGQANALGADVQLNRDSIMGVQLLVRNDSDRIWEDVVFTLDGRWKLSQRTMRPRDLVVMAVSSFRDGVDPPPRDHVPRALLVECGSGTGRFELR